MVAFVSKDCEWCKHPDFVEALDKARNVLRSRAAARGLGFVTLGVALDFDTRAGLDFLETVGPFDQVSSGYSWGNVAATSLDGAPAVLATPQLLLFHRTLATDDTGRTLPVIDESSLLANKVGLAEIKHWLGRGLPLPRNTGSMPME